MSPKIKTVKIFSCPVGCHRKRFDSLMALNVHMKKKHNSPFQMYLKKQGRAYQRKTFSKNKSDIASQTQLC